MAALSACAVPRHLEGLAIEHNQVVATTADSLTLLNILRAREGRPLHYTAISQLNGNISMSATGSLSGIAVISNGNTATLCPGVSGTLASNPAFGITIFDNQEFQQGILTPIDAKTIRLYLGTGWRADVLTYLLVERIDFVLEGKERVTIGGRSFEPKATIATLNNDPMAPANASKFAGFVTCFTLAPPRDSNADGIGLVGTGENGTGQSVAIEGGKQVTAQLVTDGQTIDLADAAGVAVTIDGGAVSVQARPVVTFRSVDGVLYFLGEYARASRQNSRQKKSGDIYVIPGRPGTGEGPEGLLTIAEGRGGRYDLSAEIDGVAWHVPAGSRRTYQVIALIEQLFNLNKKGSAPPLAAAVRVIN